MVAAHGGTITVASDGKDKGATFTVTLKTVAAPARTAAEEEPQKPAPVRTKADGQSRRRVLVVDDHHDTCTGMKMMLERRGYGSRSPTPPIRRWRKRGRKISICSSATSACPIAAVTN